MFTGFFVNMREQRLHEDGIELLQIFFSEQMRSAHLVRDVSHCLVGVLPHQVDHVLVRYRHAFECLKQREIDETTLLTYTVTLYLRNI